MSEERTVGECFQFNQETRERVVRAERDIEKVEGKMDESMTDFRQELKDTVDRLGNRLPTWATLYISFLMLLVGGLLAKAVFK